MANMKGISVCSFYNNYRVRRPQTYIISYFHPKRPSVSLSLTTAIPFHTILPFSVLKSCALQLLSSGTTSWSLCVSHLFSISFQSSAEYTPLPLPYLSVDREGKWFLTLKHLIVRGSAVITVMPRMPHSSSGDFAGVWKVFAFCTVKASA